MKKPALIKLLVNEWDLELGSLGKLRSGTFDGEGFQRLHSLLESIEVKGSSIDRRLVSLIWYIPLFMSWQIERVREKRGNVEELEDTIERILGVLHKVLGVP